MMQTVDLVPLAPTDNAGLAAALRNGEAIVAIIDGDVHQPSGIRGPSGSEPLTVEQFLAETAAWCEANRAMSYAVIASGRCVGMITLSHIDERKGCARCGWILASELWGRGLEAVAVGRIAEIARARGLKTLGGKVRIAGDSALETWKGLGARFEPCERPTHQMAVLDT